MADQVTVEKKGEGQNAKLIITIPMGNPTESSSGKTLVVGSTHGNIPTTVNIAGKVVYVGVNAYIKK